DPSGTGSAIFGTGSTITAGTFSGPTTSGSWTNTATTIGNLVPTDDTYDFGAASTRWRYAYFSRSLYGTNGSATAPVYSFSSGTNNGFYMPGANNPGVSVNGAWAGHWDNGSLYVKKLSLATGYNAGSEAIVSREGSGI